jgi:uroporphyrin-III C-methyltransferase
LAHGCVTRIRRLQVADFEARRKSRFRRSDSWEGQDGLVQRFFKTTGMTDDEPKPRVVIDVDPEYGEDAADRRAAVDSGQGAVAPARPRAWPLVFAVALVLALAGGLVWGYQHVADLRQELAALDGRLAAVSGDQAALRQTVDRAVSAASGQRDQLAAQQRVLDEQREALEATRAAFARQQQLLSDESLRLQDREVQLRAAVADVHRRVGLSGDQWIVAESEYLMRVAAHRLGLGRDVQTARIALELADQRLRDTGDPGWAGVREQLAREIARLAAYPAPDVDGLAARLAALSGRVPGLRAAETAARPGSRSGDGGAVATAAAMDAPKRSWETLLGDLWAGFKDTVRIREHDRPIQALMPPEHDFFLRENLRLQLEAARIAVARGDAGLYRDTLARAEQWLAEHFAAGDAEVQAMRVAIDELLALDIAPSLPDISGSLHVLLARRQSLADLPGQIEAAETQ